MSEIFISAESIVKIDEAFSEIAVELQFLTPDEGKDRLATKTAVLRWLTKPYMHPPETTKENVEAARDFADWLLVFDNVESASLLGVHTIARSGICPFHESGSIC